MRLERLGEWELESAFRMRNSGEVYKWCRQTFPLHWKDHRDWFEWQRKDPSTEMFVIKVEDQFLGVCGLTSIDYIARRAEFSCYIDPNERGLGFGERALRLLFQAGFSELNLNLIWGETFEHNPAKKLFEKIGMTKEGVRRDFYFKHGEYVNAILFSIKKSEFLGA